MVSTGKLPFCFNATNQERTESYNLDPWKVSGIMVVDIRSFQPSGGDQVRSKQVPFGGIYSNHYHPWVQAPRYETTEFENEIIVNDKWGKSKSTLQFIPQTLLGPNSHYPPQHIHLFDSLEKYQSLSSHGTLNWTCRDCPASNIKR